MSAEGLLFFLLALLSMGGGILLLAEGRRTISLAGGYLGIGLALSGILLLGGGLFAALFLFVLSMSSALCLLFFSIYLEGRGEDKMDLPEPGRLMGKIAGAAAMLGVVVLLAGVLPAAESAELPGAATAEAFRLGVLIFGPWGLVAFALGLIFLAALAGSLVLILGRSAE